MSKDAETTETQPKKDMADVAADAQVFRRKEVTGDLNFVSDLDALDAALEADTIIVRFNNPAGEDSIDFELTAMTPGQVAIYYQTLLGNTLLETANQTGEENTEINDALQDALAAKQFDEKLLNILESNIINPSGVTAERMRNWNPFYIQKLHNALLEGSRPSKTVANFSGVDSE